MLWLIAHMWFLLICAFALGLGIGWWLWSARATMVPNSNGANGDNLPVEQGTLETEEKTARAPTRFKAAKNGEKDDLTQIIGLDAATEKTLNRLGVFYLYQVADWGPARIRWIEDKIGEEGRIERERWVAQARTLRLQNEYEAG